MPPIIVQLHLFLKWPWIALQVHGNHLSLHISINILKHFSGAAKKIFLLPFIKLQLS